MGGPDPLAEGPGSDAKKQAANVSGSCPAFLDGCPYASNDEVVQWIKEKRPDAINSCPAFKDGCPFGEATDMEALRGKLESLPPSHSAGTSTGTATPDNETSPEKSSSDPKAHAALMEMLKKVHQASQAVKESVGGDCPVFEKACPFKNAVTSSGTPLALELETRSWGLFVQSTPAAVAEVNASDADVEEKAPADADGEGLAKKLKEGTKVAHKAAETVHFVHEFIKGRVTREIYSQLVVNLFHVYSAIEEALEENCEHPLVEPLYFPDELDRKETLRQDAEFFLGSNWESETMPSKVTREYVARIKEIARDSPELLVPHSYTRYLGDLSGGQVLRRCAVRGMKLPDDGSGVRFYMFNRIRDAKAFKNMYRARMDSLPADSATADRMVVEANHAFNLNTRIFQELDSLAGFEAEPLPPPPTTPAGPAAKAGAEAAAAGCPFAALAANGVAMPAGHPPAAKEHDKGIKEPVSSTLSKTDDEDGGDASVKYTQLTALLAALVCLIAALLMGGNQ
eukprot:TRINITY_DN39492_c0_g1_i1.p1 TRINITY_DN39492_c0_g1~~TRINITY_DN39492_c0_g1_i1.p1  ORF type:complete len:512 (-),score=148.56 TRINITY_DN39492_c0_g1_i1:199-1734(-)